MSRSAAALLGLVAAANAVDVTLTCNLTSPLHTVATPYLAYNIDTGSIFNGFDFSNQKLVNLVKGLAPTIVRVGGTAADYAKYEPNSPAHSEGTADTIVNDATWDQIIAFTKATGIHLMWDFNGLYRDTAHHWTPAVNATAFLAYTNSKYAGMDIIWSVGERNGGGR